MALTEQLCRVVLYEGPGAQALNAQERYQLVAALLEKGFPVACLGSTEKTEHSEGLRTIVLGHFDSAPPSDTEHVRWHALNGAEPGEVAEKLSTRRREWSSMPVGHWKPWFPVIDYDRCTNCMQCLSFCLFGVYGVDSAQRIQVQNQDNCKTNCPACSRVCPEAAIMFPKYKAGPINGDVVSDSDLNREKMKIDISALLGGDVYAMLRTRSERAQSRFSKERDSDKALAERQKCLTKLASDIPPEVLMSLPSPEEIARKAAEAAARVAAIKQASAT